MDDFSDENGEGEFIDFLEELGERESDSLLDCGLTKTYFLLLSNRSILWKKGRVFKNLVELRVRVFTVEILWTIGKLLSRKLRI